MSNRVSTVSQQAAAVAAILKQQTALAKTQQQVSSGLRIQTPADDPVAMTQVLAMQSQKSQIAQYGKNSDVLSARLGTGEQALSDVNDLLQAIRDLAVQANDSALDDSSLQSIAVQLKSYGQQLLDISNRSDTNGEYLFSGYSTQTQPFSNGSSGVVYSGDQGVRSLQISSSQKIADSIPGDRVFMGVPGGNGTFTVAAGVHAGTGIVDSGDVVDPTAWVSGNYTIEFTAADSWQVLDGSGNPVLDGSGNPVTGTYTDGGAITFNGIEVHVSGTPAAGDTFTVAPAGVTSLFDTVTNLVNALQAGTGTDSKRALLTTNINQALTQLDQGLSHVSDLRSEVGARLAAVDNASTVRTDTSLQLDTSISNLQDLDYADALSKMTQQMTALQAAEQAYTRIGQMSLFDYLR